MAIERLNLRLLRRAMQRSAEFATSLGPSDVQLSRRSFLSLSGASLAVSAVPPFLLGNEFSLEQEGPRVHLLLDNERRWTIDPKVFGERAQVRVKNAVGNIIIELRNGTFPGTSVPADFVCRLDSSDGKWMFRFSMECGIEVSSLLLDWLKRKTTAAGSWKTLHFVPFDGMSVDFASTPTVRFEPDWVFTVSAPSRLTLRGLDEALPASNIGVILNSTTHLAGGVVDRSTSFVIPRDSKEWEIDLTRRHATGWRLDNSKDASLFDELTVEAADADGKVLLSALLRQNPDNCSTLTFQPVGELCDDCGELFTTSLCNTRFAFCLEDSLQSVLIADMREEKSWAHGIRASYLIGASPEAPHFELHDSPGDSGTPRFSPGICEICFPHDDACINLKLETPRSAVGWWQLSDANNDKSYIDLGKTDCLSIERPADFLSLQFYFENMRLVTGQTPSLVHASKKDHPALVKVLFPPQNVAEQAFFINRPDETGVAQVDVPIGCVELTDYDPKKPCTPQNLAQLKGMYDPDYATQTSDVENDKPDIRFSDITRLVFGLPREDYEIPCNIDALLNWKDWTPIIVPVAQSVVNTGKPDEPPDLKTLPPIIDPTDEYTSIEMPFRLKLSPSELGRWAHSVVPVESVEKVVEMWHTRLGVKPRPNQHAQKDHHLFLVDEVNTKDRTARAIWSSDYVSIPLSDPGSCSTAPSRFPNHYSRTDPQTGASPFRMSLDIRDRCELVHLTSNYAITQQEYFCTNNQITPPRAADLLYPAPVQINRMMLTAMGGYLDAFGQWNPCKVDVNNQLTVQMWNHRATLGRDHYVKVVYKGYLAPFGLRASLVKVTQRVFKQNSAGNWIAPLHQHMYIVVKDERKQCPIMGQPFGGRGFPFSYVEPVTLTTPFLNDPTSQHWPQDCSRPQTQSLFWPMVASTSGTNCTLLSPPDPPGVAFSFRLRFTDVTGAHSAEASMPLLFVASDVAQKTGYGTGSDYCSQDAVDFYNQGSVPSGPNVNDPYITADFSGQKFSFAQSSKPGDTDFETSILSWQAVPLTNIRVIVTGATFAVASNPPYVTFTKRNSNTNIERRLDSSGSFSLSLGNGDYFVTVTTPQPAPAPPVTVSSAPTALTVDERQSSVIAIALSDPAHFSSLPTITQVAKVPSPLDLYRYDLPYFYPAVDYARITSTSIKRITGSSSPTKFNFAPIYLSDGFNAKTNPGEVFLEKNTDDDLTLAFGGNNQNVDKAGGLASPDTTVVGFSRHAGAVGGTKQKDRTTGKSTVTTSITTYSSGKFDPADFFGGLASAKLLGAVKLSDIIAAVSPGLVSNLLKAPQMLEQALYTGETTVQKYLTDAVDAIRAFQTLQTPPPNPIPNPLAAPLASAAQQVFAANDALNNTDPTDVIDRGLAEAQVIARIADYASAAQNAVQNPLSLVEDAVIQALGQAFQSAVGDVIQTVLPPLNALAGTLTDALDQQIQNLATGLEALEAVLQDSNNAVTDDITALKLKLSALAPELNNLAPPKQDTASPPRLIDLVQQLSGSIKGIGASIATFSNDPTQLQQLAKISGDLSNVGANLRQIYEKAGYFGVVYGQAATGTALNAALKQAQKSLNDLWSTIDYTAAADDLATLQENCIKLASAWDQTHAEGQQILQNIRQLQNNVNKAAAYRDKALHHLPDTPQKLYRQLQLLQKMQAHMLKALTALQALANETIPGASSQVVLQAQTDIQNAVSPIADKLTVSPQLLNTAAGVGKAIEQQIAAVTADPNASKPQQALWEDLQQQLTTLRSQIAKDPFNVALKLAHYNLSIDYQRPVAAALSYIAYLQDMAITAFQNFVAFLQPIEALALQLQQTLCFVQTLWTNFITEVGKVLGPNDAPIGQIIVSIYGTEIDAITAAFKNLCDPAQIAPSQFLRNGQQVVAAFVALETDIRSKIPSLSTIEAALIDAVKQEVETLLEQLLNVVPIPTSVNLSYTWQPDIQSFEPVFILQDDASFTVNAKAQAALNSQLNGVSASFDVDAELTNFAIVLIGEDPFITIYIDSVTFTSKNGSKPDCRLKLDHVELGDQMKFVEDLAKALDPSQGPFVELADASIRAGFRFAIESMTLGAFNLMQLAIEVAVSLPFDGTPVRCEFNLSDQQHPFLLSCGIYGGGGFLQLLLGLDGVQLLQGAFEFGVCADISIGPLQGNGFVVAGIYFRITGNSAEVCGFVHAHGHMDIFGIISMDVDLYVAVCFQSPNTVQGIATFAVSVSIAFFSETFSMQAQYTFAGSPTSTADSRLTDRSPRTAEAFLVSPEDEGETMIDAYLATSKKSKSNSGVNCPGNWQSPLFIDPKKWKNYYNSFVG